MSKPAGEGRVRAADVPAGAQLRARHRSNPNGEWRVIGALTERPSNQWHVEALIRRGWRRVVFSPPGAPKGRSGGARAGAGRKPNKDKEVTGRKRAAGR